MSIQLINLNKHYRHQKVVNQVSLEIESGELLVLLGASGSGKSTILRMIAGLTPMDGGEVWLNGQNVTHLSPQKREVGFVFQNYSLFPHMTVEQNIAFGLSVKRLSTAEKRERVAELLDLIELQGYEKRLPSQLSGGQQQRVALARALAPNPRVLLLDEPFGALDAKIRLQLRRNLREIQQRLGVTAILVTHDQEEAFDVADRIGILEKGQLLEVGTPSQLYRQPCHAYTAAFLGNANFIPAQRNSHMVYLGETFIPVPPHTENLENLPAQLMFRPEDVQLANHQSELDGMDFGIGQIEKLAFAGAFERATIRLSSPLDTYIEVQLLPNMAWEEGQTVYVGLKNYHLLPVN